MVNSLTEYPHTLDARSKSSDGGYLRKPLADHKIQALYRGLTDPEYKGSCLVYLPAYGGQINTVSPTETAVPQRDSILKLWISSTWSDPALDKESIDWTRRLRRSIHAETGGVPVLNDSLDGCYINYPDVDLRDPAWNTSGIPWHTLYYKDSYPRLQRVKSEYDPLNIFQHALSIQPANNDD